MVPQGLEGRRTQFAIDLLYGLLFVAGFLYLVLVRFEPLVAAFLGGIVIGYFLHVWEKMSTYERVLQEAVTAEAERQVGAEIEREVAPSVEAEVEKQVGQEIDREVGPSVEAEVEEQVGQAVEKEVERQVGERVDEEVERRVSEQLEETDGGEEVQGTA